MKPRRLVIILAAVANLAASAALAQETSDKNANTPAETFTDWRVSCDGEEACRMSQTIVQPSTGRLILQAKLYAQDNPTLLLSFPLGILLSTGWTYQIDNQKAVIQPFEVCNTDGCHAGIILQSKLINAMKRGLQMRVVFRDAAGTPVSPTVSLKGFTKAWDVVQSK